jgi:hypothetical protein
VEASGVILALGCFIEVAKVVNQRCTKQNVCIKPFFNDENTLAEWWQRTKFLNKALSLVVALLAYCPNKVRVVIATVFSGWVVLNFVGFVAAAKTRVL